MIQAAAPERSGVRVGLFGILGSGNLGNDGSLEAIVHFLRGLEARIELTFFCMGPDVVAARYGAPAASLQWYEAHSGQVGGPGAVGLKVLGRLLDPFRTFAWVRQHDVVIVPGMGVLEATVPIRPWAFPYSLFWLCAAARVTGTRVALVTVGSDVVQAWTTRWLLTWAARLAHYRSFRDELSREAMRAMGVDASRDEVYADLTFSLPTPQTGGPTGVVAVGVMAYRGSNDDRAEAGQLQRHYLKTLTQFVHWLLDGGRAVRLYATDQEDHPILQALLTAVLAQRSDDPDIAAEPVSTLTELMARLAEVDTVVGSRYHNVLCAVKLCKPTLSVGYAAKHGELMGDMGLADFCEPAHSVDLTRLIAKFQALESDREALVATLNERNAEKRQLLNQQFTALRRVVMPLPDRGVGNRLRRLARGARTLTRPSAQRAPSVSINDSEGRSHDRHDP